MVELSLKLSCSPRQNTFKLLFFRQHNLGHPLRSLHQLRISHLHLIPYCEDHLMHKRLLLPQQPSMPNPASQNLPQHIAPPFIRRQHTIRDQKRSRARMVRDDPQRSCALLIATGSLLPPISR